MASRRVQFTEGEYYHIYNRGVDKRIIYTSHSEYVRFMAYLVMMNSKQTVRADTFLSYSSRTPRDVLSYRIEPLVAIGAFCLMPNHFHLLLTPLCEKGIERFMHRIGTAYTMFFNTAHERSGSLFQGTYKAVHTSTDRHLKYLYSYIHLNPANEKYESSKALSTALTYKYSSMSEYVTRDFAICDPEKFPKYFMTKQEFVDLVRNVLEMRDEFRGEAEPSL